MKPSIQSLLHLQNEYEVLSCIEELLQTHIDRVSDWNDNSLAEKLEEVRNLTFERLCEVHDEARLMAKRLRLHRSSKN